MRTRPNTIRARRFNGLLWLNLPLAAFSAVVLFGQNAELSQRPLFSWFAPLEVLFGSDFERPWVYILLFVVTAAYLVAYASSFDWRAGARPCKRLFFLHAQIASVAACAAAAGLGLLPELAVVLVALAATACPLAVWGIERLLGRGLAAWARWLLRGEKYNGANMVLSAAVYLKPADETLHRSLGLSRFDAGDVLGALDALEPLAGEDCKDRQLLETIEECYRTERQWENALRVSCQLLALDPSDAPVRMRIAQGLENLNRSSDAVEVLRQGLPASRIDYLELLLRLLVAENDIAGAVDAARQIEGMELPPKPRSFRAYQSILDAAPDSVLALEAFGDCLVEHMKRDEGYQCFERILALDPQRHDLRVRLVQHFQETDRLDSAEPHLEALMDAGRDTVDVALLYGDILVQREQYDKALLHFQYAVENYPDDYRFAYFLARISLRTDALEDAARWCDEAQKRAASSADRARIEALRHRVDEALMGREIQVWRERSNRDPDNIDLKLNLLAAMTRHGMADEAVAEYDELLQARPDLEPRVMKEVEALVKESNHGFRLMDFLADLKIRAEQWDEAFEIACRLAERSLDGGRLLIEHCRRILERQPDHLPSLRCLGRTLIQKKDYAEAVEVHKQRLELGDEEDAENVTAVFEAYAFLGDTDKAVEIGERYISAHPRDIDMRVKLAHLYRDAQRYDEGLNHLRAAQSVDYYHGEVVSLINELVKLRRSKRLEHLLAVLKEKPDNPALDLEAGDLYSEMGETKKAITHYQRAVGDPKLKNLAGAKLAQTMALLGMFDLADETLEEVSLRIDDPDQLRKVKALFYNVAELFQENKQNERALRFFKKIFRVDASYRNVVEKVESLST